MSKFKILLFVVVLSVVSFSCKKEKETYSDLEKEVLALINSYRVDNGLPELEMNQVIWIDAKNHSEDMASGNIPFSHDGFNDRCDKIVTEIEGVNSIAENIAVGPDAQSIVEIWLASTQGHKETIEGDFNLTGIGIAVDATNSYYCTQIFAKLP